MAARKAKTEEQQQVTNVPEPPPVLAARPNTGLERARDEKDKLISLRDELFRESMGVLRDAMRFSDVQPELKELDPAIDKFNAELGQANGQRAYRLALYASMPSGDAPIGLKLAANVAVGIMKANAAEKGGTHVLNVSKVVLSADALPVFEEREVEHE